MEKDLLPMQKTQVWSLGWEDPLEEEMATHSCILAWRIPWTEEPVGPPSMVSQSLSQLGTHDHLHQSRAVSQTKGHSM